MVGKFLEYWPDKTPLGLSYLKNSQTIVSSEALALIRPSQNELSAYYFYNNQRFHLLEFLRFMWHLDTHTSEVLMRVDRKTVDALAQRLVKDSYWGERTIQEIIKEYDLERFAIPSKARPKAIIEVSNQEPVSEKP